MPTDAHYNEPGDVPEAVDDHQPTDLPATRNMFKVMLIVAIVAMIVLIAIDMAR